MPKPHEYVIIGAGPAAICTIIALLKNGVTAREITWIDPKFEVGDFGALLSEGSSVPGNTKVKDYQKVYQEIYLFLRSQGFDIPPFDIDRLEGEFVCSLKMAAMPMHFITETLREMVNSVVGFACDISESESGLQTTVSTGKETLLIPAKRVILATGAIPKKLPAEYTEIFKDITIIDPNTAFIFSKLKEYIVNNPHIKELAVIGSSHSAALAVMHLLQLGIAVKQFTTNEYRYAKELKSENRTQYDNIGLKGDVAKFTKELLAGDLNVQQKYQRYLVPKKDMPDFFAKNRGKCQHAVVAIGYQANLTFTINHSPAPAYNTRTTAFDTIPGLFGVGIAFPKQVDSPEGVEYAIGVGKFWKIANDEAVLQLWNENTAPISRLSELQFGLFSTTG